jgi:large subunit ribosomal protein L10
MALTKDRKAEIVNETDRLLTQSKLTVMARYSGTSVKSMQSLRGQAKDSGTLVRVIKNRLVKKSMENSDKFKDISTDFLQGQLLYAFNEHDELAPAQVLANFAKTGLPLEFVGALTSDGQFMPADDVMALASLPGKEQLRAQLVGTIAGPISGMVNVLTGNVRGILNVLNARADTL